MCFVNPINMKRTALILITTIAVVIGCKSPKKSNVAPITPRNTAITESNAYNNFFLDTAAIGKFITQQKLNDTIANRVRSFYNARNFQFAWFDTAGLTEQAYGFRSLYDYSKDSSEQNRSLEYRLNAMMKEDEDSAISPTNADIVKTELQLTQRFIHYFLETYKESNIRVNQLEHFVPLQKQEVLKMADSLLADKNRDAQKFAEVHGAYGSLTAQLQKYAAIVKKGGWNSIPVEKKKYKKGDNAPAITLIKKRLQVTGELTDKDTTGIFNDALESAVKTFEQSRGHTPRGIITDTLVKEMNVPAIAQLQTLLINMERMRWMPPEQDGRLIMVNIPEFVLHVWNGNKKEFDMEVVVGKEGKSTTMFSGNLNQLVFSPNWNLPRSIVKEEVLPSMSRNKHYLQDKNMEITGERNGVPVIRQLPGKDNPLGRVKFLFPNSFNIYFHDTNEKALFSKDKRAYSHGCIRLGDPVKMANYLLKDAPKWTPEKIDSAMNSGKEKYVAVKDPVPVLITYYTAWVDENGVLQFREDIYDHDSTMAQKMFITATQQYHAGAF